MVARDETRDRLEVGRPAPEPDDLTRIRGLGAGLARRLADRGIVRFAQIAAWSAEDVRTIAAALGLGREISRRNWIEQAALLELRRPAAQRPAALAVSAEGAHAVELHHVLQHIRTAAGLQVEPPASAAAAGGAPTAPAAEDAQPPLEEREAKMPESLHGGDNLVRPALEPEEASVTFVIRKPAPVPPGGATARGAEGQVAGPSSRQWDEGGAEAPLLAPLDGDGEEAEVVIVSRRTPEPRSRKA
jgi:hypothetical protein